VSDLLDRIVEMERRIAILEAGTGTGLGGTDQTIKGCHDRLDAIMGAGKSSVPRCRVYPNAAQTIASGSWTAIAFDNEIYDTDTMHDNSTNNTRITATTAGAYHIGCAVEWAAAAGGSRWVAIRANGSSILSTVKHSPSDVSMVTSVDYALTAGQYIEMVVKQDSGGDLDVSSQRFWAHKIG